MINFFFLLGSNLNLLLFDEIVRFIIIDSNVFAFIVNNFSILESSSILGPIGQFTSFDIIFTLSSMEHPAIKTIIRTIRTTSITRYTLFSAFTPTTFTSLSTNITICEFRTEFIIFTIYSVTELAYSKQFFLIQCLESIVACIIDSEDFQQIRINIQLFDGFSFLLTWTFGSWREVSKGNLFFMDFGMSTTFLFIGQT